MTKVLFSFILVSTLAFVGCNQQQKMIDHEWTVYNAVIANGDLTSAIICLNRIAAVDKYNANALDTLAILYLNAGSFEAAHKIASRALNVRESDELTKTIARASKNLGKHEESLEHFSKLLAKNPDNLEWLYEVAFANINLSKLNEAMPHIQKIIINPESGSAVMTEFIKGGSQLLPYKAVAFNMLGFIQSKVGQTEDAILSYETALQIFPNYYLAKNNLAVSQETLAKSN